MIADLKDYFTVAIDSKYEEAKTKSGIILMNTAYIDDQDMDRYQHKRLYGEVLAVPEVFTDTPYRAIDPGQPTPRKSILHDDIIDRINRGYRNHAEKTYCPSTFDAYEVITYADLAKQIDVKKGDLVYFTPQTTEDENLIGKHNGRDVYKVLLSDIWCSSDGVTLKMQGEWVLVKPKMETWEDITSPAGVIKKPCPDAKYLEGIVAHTRHAHLRQGQHILYVPDANCEIRIQNEIFYIMPVQDILGELTDKI